jgi:hypothetical protein
MQDDETDVIRKAMSGQLTKREFVQIGLSEEAKRAIKRIIEVSPALEEAILDVAELCYRDGSLSDLTTEQMVSLLIKPVTEPEIEQCPICGKEHKPDQTIAVADGHLIPGHEYVITTKTSLQKYPRKWRMGFLGAYDRALQFSARGPDRTHRGQYGGTQTIPATTILSVREVEADHSKRYVGVPVK